MTQISNAVGLFEASFQIPGNAESRLVTRYLLTCLEQDGVGALAEADQQYFGTCCGLLQRCRKEEQRVCGTGMAALPGKPCFLESQNFAETFCHSRRSRKDDVNDTVSRNAVFQQQRRYGVRNNLKKSLVADPAILHGIVEATGPGPVVIHEITTNGTMSQAARQHVLTATHQHSRRAMPGLHLQGTGRARLAAVAGNAQRRAGRGTQRVSECGSPCPL